MASSSQSSTSVNSPLTLSLCKLSYTTTATLQGKLIWTHLPQRDNLFAVYKDMRRAGPSGLVSEKRHLKLVQNGHVLETIDLDDLMSQALSDEERALFQTLPESQRSLFIIVKKPLVAIRYRTHDGYVRRIQMNFLPAWGYDQTVEILGRLRLPMQDKNPPIQFQLQPRPSSLSTLPCSNISPGNSQSNGDSNQYIQASQESLYNNPSSQLNEIRPATAPELNTQYSSIDLPTLSQMLPPKRELPFPKRVTKPPSKDPKANIPFSSSAPLPAQKVVEVGGVAKKRASKAKSPKPKITKPRSRGKAAPQMPTSSPLRSDSIIGPSGPNASYIPSTSSVTALQSSDAGMPPSSPLRPIIGQGPMTNLPANKANARQNNPSDQLQDPTTRLQQINKIFENSSSEDYLGRLDFLVRRYQNLPTPAPTAAPLLHSATENLAAYAAQSPDDRMTAIDDMICQCLQDENFITLCEDVENSWRRIGLGF